MTVLVILITTRLYSAYSGRKFGSKVINKKMTKTIITETVELNTVDKNMKFALVKSIVVCYQRFEEKIVRCIHLSIYYLHYKSAYSTGESTAYTVQ